MTNRKSHTRFRLVPKSTTLNDLERPIHTLLPKRCVFRSPPQKICMKIDPHYQRQKYSPMTLLFGDIRFCGYSRSPWGRGVKRQLGCRQRQFSAFMLVISSEPLGIRPTLLYSGTQSIFGFTVIPKCVTLNDLEWLFQLNSVFAPACQTSDYATAENNCAKLIKIGTYSQRRISLAGILVSGCIRFMWIFARVL